MGVRLSTASNIRYFYSRETMTTQPASPIQALISCRLQEMEWALDEMESKAFRASMLRASILTFLIWGSAANTEIRLIRHRPKRLLSEIWFFGVKFITKFGVSLNIVWSSLHERLSRWNLGSVSLKTLLNPWLFVVEWLALLQQLFVKASAVTQK